MTKEELAARLNGREMGEEMSDYDQKDAKTNGLVVIFGSSDDLIEVRGAIHDEGDCYDGGDMWLKKTGFVRMDDDESEVLEKFGVLADYMKDARLIKAIFGKGDYSWTYETAIPHACFDIVEDGEKYCRGIVFSISDL